MDDIGAGLDINFNEMGIDIDTEEPEFGENNLGLNFDDAEVGQSGTHLSGISIDLNSTDEDDDEDEEDLGIGFSLDE